MNGKIVDLENLISELSFIREKLHNGIFGERSTPALTDAIACIRELAAIKTSHERKAFNTNLETKIANTRDKSF